MIGQVDASESLWIESTRGPDDEPVCLVTWGAWQGYPTVADVRTTALDLVTCAAYAEMMLELVVRAELPPATVGHFASHLLSGQDRRFFGAKSTVTMLPAGGTEHGRRVAMVLLKRGSHEGMVSPAEARKMALQWLEAAEATESDQLVSEALRAAGADQETIFGYLRALRG